MSFFLLQFIAICYISDNAYYKAPLYLEQLLCYYIIHNNFIMCFTIYFYKYTLRDDAQELH